MAAMIATERRLRMRMPERELVVQNVVNWRTVRGYGEQWRGSSIDWSPEQIAGWLKRSTLKTSVIRCHTSDLPQLIRTNTWRATRKPI